MEPAPADAGHADTLESGRRYYDEQLDHLSSVLDASHQTLESCGAKHAQSTNSDISHDENVRRKPPDNELQLTFVIVFDSSGRAVANLPHRRPSSRCQAAPRQPGPKG